MRAIWILIVLALLVCQSTLLAQKASPSASPASTPVVTEAELKQKLADVRSRIAAIEGNAQTGTGEPAPSSDARLAEKYFLGQLVQTYERHLFDLQGIAEQNERKKQLEASIGKDEAPSNGPPYSLSLIDSLRDSIAALDLQEKGTVAARKFIDTELDAARTALKQADAEVRQATEKLESGGLPPEQQDQIKSARDLAQIKSAAAGAAILQFTDGQRLVDLSIANIQKRRELLNSQLARTVAHESFTQSDFDQVLARIKVERTAAEKANEQANEQLAEQARLLDEADAKLANAQKSGTSQNLDVLTETVSLRNQEAQTAKLIAQLQQGILDGIRESESMWTARFAKFKDRDLTELQKLEEGLSTAVANLLGQREYLSKMLELGRSQVAEKEIRLRELPPNSPLIPLNQEVIGSLKKSDDIAEGALSELGRRERLYRNWMAMIHSDGAGASFTSRVQAFLIAARQIFASIWNFELLTVADSYQADGQTIVTQRPITAGKIIQVILILGLGYVACKYLSLLMRKVATHRMRLHAEGAALLGKWVFSVGMLIVIIWGLVVVKIPFAAFAFMGGALAIGIGFGTQNLLKNLISGIMLLMERPMRIGDIIEVSGTRGRVSSIGIRSSVIRRADGIETLVPNSTFLENAVTNLTYTTKELRFSIEVTVSYESDPRIVSKLLVKIANDHGLVLKIPEPASSLIGFAEKGLVFSLSFWLDLGRADSTQVSSDLRYMILARLKESGIQLAYLPETSEIPSAPLVSDAKMEEGGN
jgi:potassium efflux system protein